MFPNAARILTLIALSGVGGIRLCSQSDISVVSPFAASSPRVDPSPTSSGPYELTGVVNSARQTLVGIMKINEGRSFWIPVGSSDRGIDVISHDRKNDQVVIRADGVLYALGLRSQSVVGALPNLTNIGTVPLGLAASSPAGQIAQQQEARMLVSDLLELGLQQRNTQQRKSSAAAEKARLPSANSGPK